MARASFSTLPVELKARIVEMTSVQEDAWKSRVKDPTERAAHINSLSSLALVNEELRGLAAKHQFRVLLSRRASTPIFRYRILPRYGHHIVEITFAKTEQTEGIELAFSIMGQLPSLRGLVFTRNAARWLFGPGVKLSDDHLDSATSMRAEMVTFVAKEIDSLVLEGFKPSEAVALVRRFAKLKTLYFRELDVTGGVEELQSLASALASLRRLTHLVVDLPAGSEGGWPTDAFGPLERDPPPLKTLQLLWFPLDHHTLNLLGLFGETLETLCLDVWSPDPSPDLSTRDPLQLPCLATLNLSVMSLLPLKDVLRLFPSSSTFSHFSLGDSPTYVDPATDPDILSFLTSKPTLRHVQLGEFGAVYPIKPFPLRHILPPSSQAAYTDLVHSRNLDPSVLDRAHLTPYHANAELNYTKTDFHLLASALGRTLGFGQVELERLVTEGNIAKAVGWVSKLKALEDERLAWRD